ncbi:hypothetical protein PPYR_10725 [Photinus pyralis]|uniref:Bromo domain-containing protein n=1 Tax=Photinus pyralis TaxID=7054 RepID=A0A5N4AH82_PHOPY|nr:protein mitoshell isoform X2 [Photinus pyralis]KAB0796664.1 hypothetical protein PPYR_10725 [Photinus pyralis]
MDQNRQEANPAQNSLQVHMHLMCCPCNGVMYPYYAPGYRPPILTQPPPLPRPSYLHHYQYTQLHVNPPYSLSLPPPITQTLPANICPMPSAIEIAFEPPPRDRRILDKQDSEDNRNALTPFVSLGENSSMDQLKGIFRNLTASQVASLSTDNYIRYLDNGCFIGESIAKRNEQRPCFKNIQNLCNRTRSEVTKPNITVSNIHSQGLPWATKDFIFAFVRAINCWCILRGYLGPKDGNLGKIDREITDEFRECYANWEKCTKKLTYHLIQTFHNLDEANSSSNLNAQCPKPKFPSPQEPQRRKEAPTQNKIPGILHIPSTSSADVVDDHPQSESTISPREEDSDSECRTYMKPGSYNVPKRESSPNLQTAQSVAPDFIRLNQVSAFNDSVKKISNMSVFPPVVDSWLGSEASLFEISDGDDEKLSHSKAQWDSSETDCEVLSNPYRGSPIGKEYSTYRRSAWEYRNGGLTTASWGVFENILKELDRLDISKAESDLSSAHLDLSTISKKVEAKMYYYVNEVIHDFRQFISCAYDTFSRDRCILIQVGLFRDAFEKMVKQSFVGLDFSHITGEDSDSVGPLVFVEGARNVRNPEGDGDH